jgi:hypothetical protein
MNQKITGKETTMKFKVMTPVFALVLVAGFVALTLSLRTGAAPVREGCVHLVFIAGGLR